VGDAAGEDAEALELLRFLELALDLLALLFGQVLGVTSMTVPSMRTGVPCTSRRTAPRATSQRVVPSGRRMRSS